MPRRYLGVDIGNSGLRAVELNLTERRLGTSHRLYWSLDDSFGKPASAGNASPSAHSALHEPYRPDDRKWLRELRHWITSATGTDWLISSVRRDACRILVDAIATNSNHRVLLVQHDQLPLRVLTEQPQQVGIDRLLAALAAADRVRSGVAESSTCGSSRWQHVVQKRRLQEPAQMPAQTEVAAHLEEGSQENASGRPEFAPLIVIQAGSAVTVDLVTWQGEQACFEGGAIVPGVPMMLRLLGTAADMLPMLNVDDLIGNELSELPELPGRNTEQAMRCGAASALVGGVMHLVSRYRTLYASSESGHLPVILSGGDGPRLAPFISEPLVVEPDLVQRGLLALAIAKFNQRAESDFIG